MGSVDILSAQTDFATSHSEKPIKLFTNLSAVLLMIDQLTLSKLLFIFVYEQSSAMHDGRTQGVRRSMFAQGLTHSRHSLKLLVQKQIRRAIHTGCGLRRHV